MHIKTGYCMVDTGLFFSFSFTPFTYMNFWMVVIGTAFGWMSVYGTNQTSVQRYTSLSSLRKAQTYVNFAFAVSHQNKYEVPEHQ